jgi:rare lipoprotein A
LRSPRDIFAADWPWIIAAIVVGLAIVIAGALAVHAAKAASFRCHGQEGIASWYGAESGRRTANDEPFPTGEATAAHRSLPFGSHVRVTDMATGRSVVVRVNDRGPFVPGRIMDLSPAAARALG